MTKNTWLEKLYKYSRETKAKVQEYRYHWSHPYWYCAIFFYVIGNVKQTRMLFHGSYTGTSVCIILLQIPTHKKPFIWYSDGIWFLTKGRVQLNNSKWHSTELTSQSGTSSTLLSVLMKMFIVTRLMDHLWQLTIGIKLTQYLITPLPKGKRIN